VSNSYISKTAYLKFEQCEKAFFLYKNHYYLRDKPSVDKQITFQRGHDVGALAQQLFPGGVNVVEHDQNKERAMTLTAELIAKKTPVIYEATFVYQQVLVMVDILVLTNEGYEMYEVKSSVKISETYIKDACLQYHVVKNHLHLLKDVFIVTLNDSYVLKDQLDLKQLFRRRSVLKDALKNENYFKEQLKRATVILDQGVIPNIVIGKQCFSPYECDFLNTCWKDKKTEDSIFELGKVSKEQLFDWYNQGVKRIQDIPVTEQLKNDLRIQVNAVINKETHLSKEGIVSVLKNLKEPFAAIDMEIWGQAVPELKGTKPFQKIPFLFTLHGDSISENHYFEYERDDRRLFAEALIASTNQFMSLLVYDKSMELLIIAELCALFPELEKKLRVVSSKFVDIAEIIQKNYYHHFLLRGNFSLKTVSKVVLEEDLFAHQTVFTGLEAMNAFVSYRRTTNPIERQSIKEQLIEYCSADTKACYLVNLKFLEMIKAEQV
jgi:hypothetical protein